MDVFHIPAPAVAIDDAHKALIAQDALIQPVQDKLFAAVVDGFAAQDMLLGDVKRKLNRAVNTAQNKRDKLIDAVQASAINVAAGQMAHTQDLLTQVQERLPPGGLVQQADCWVVLIPPGHTPIIVTLNAAHGMAPPGVILPPTFPTSAAAQLWATSPEGLAAWHACANSGVCGVAPTVCGSIGTTGGGGTGAPPPPSNCLVSFDCDPSSKWPAVLCLDFTLTRQPQGLTPSQHVTSCAAIQTAGVPKWVWPTFPVGPNPPGVTAKATAWLLCAAGVWTMQLDVEYNPPSSCVFNFAWHVPASPPFTLQAVNGYCNQYLSGTLRGASDTEITAFDPVTLAALCSQTSTGGGGTTGGTNGQVCCPPETLAPAPRHVTLVPSKCKIGGVEIPILPSPGSEDWCDAQEKILQFWVDVGKSLVDLYKSAINFITPESEESGRTVATWFVNQTIPGAAVANGLIELIKGIREDYGGFVQQCVQCAEALAAALPGCNPIAVTALWTVKSILQALERFRLGTDAALWATLDIRFRPEQLIRMLDYLIAAACPVEIPTVGEAMEAYRQGQIGLKTYNCWVRMNGANPDVWSSVLTARSERLGSRELIEWSRRHKRPDAQAGLDLLEHGWLRDEDRDKRLELFDELPTINDHLHWLQRNVFDVQYVADYQLMQGFDDKFWPLFGDDLRARGMKKQYAALHYAAHWLQPSPTQMQEFVWRLRPDVVGEGHVFTVNDYERLLMEQDYAPLARQWFADTVYRRFAPGALVALFRNNVITTQQLISGYRDFGYTEADSTTLAANDEIIKTRERVAAYRGFGPTLLGALYRTGLMSDADVDAQMLKLGYTVQESHSMMAAAVLRYQQTVQDASAQLARRRLSQALTTSYSAGIVEQGAALAGLVSTGFTQAAALVMLQSLDLTEKSKLATSLTNTMRKGYLRGELSDQEAITYLSQAGITQQHIADLLLTWRIERSGSRSQASAAMILRWFNEGLIPFDVAANRLRNLHWTDPDIMLLLQESGMKPNTFNRLKHSEQNKLVADLKRQEPLGQLKKWYKDGKLSAQYVHDRMRDYRYAESTIARYIAQWDEEMLEAARKAADKAAGRPTSPKQQMTHAELRKALQDGLLTATDIAARLASEGYDPGTVAILIGEWQAK